LDADHWYIVLVPTEGSEY